MNSIPLRLLHNVLINQFRGIDFPPDVIESIFDELDDPADATRVLAGLPPSESGWLARHIRDLMRKERRSATEELESELKVR